MILVGLMLFISLPNFVFGQNELNNPNVVYDRFGKAYTPYNIEPSTKTSVNAGYFELIFEENSGFDDATYGDQRKDVIIQVLKDISVLLNPTGTVPSSLPNGERVKIQVFSQEVIPSTALAGASSYYKDFGSGFSNGNVWEYLTTSNDPYTYTTFEGWYHGYLGVNFNKKWNLDYLSYDTEVSEFIIN